MTANPYSASILLTVLLINAAEGEELIITNKIRPFNNTIDTEKKEINQGMVP